MRNEEKLEHFNEVILKEAARERDEILKDAKNEIDGIIETKKQEFQKRADEMFNKAMLQANKEKNIAISKAYVESRKILMEKRENIINSIINDVKKQLEQFAAKEDLYYDYLKEVVRKSCIQAGEGELILYLNRRDNINYSKIINKAEKELLSNVQIVESDVDFIGGCKVLNKSAGIIIDNTWLRKLEIKKDEFLEGEINEF